MLRAFDFASESWPFARWPRNAGSAIAARIPMIRITTRSSISVKPDSCLTSGRGGPNPASFPLVPPDKRNVLLPGVVGLAAALGRAAGRVAGTQRRAATVLRDREVVAGLRCADDRVVSRAAGHCDVAALQGGRARDDRKAGATELGVVVTLRVVLGVGEARLDLGSHVPGVRLGV